MWRRHEERGIGFGLQQSFGTRKTEHEQTTFSERDDGEVEIEDGGGEKEGVGEVENTADARKGVTGVFDLSAALDDGFGEVARDAGEAEDGRDDESVSPGEREEFVRGDEQKGDGTADGGDEGTDKTFPGFGESGAWMDRSYLYPVGLHFFP